MIYFAAVAIGMVAGVGAGWLAKHYGIPYHGQWVVGTVTMAMVTSSFKYFTGVRRHGDD